MKNIFLVLGALAASLPACASPIERAEDEPVESQESAQTGDPWSANWLQGAPITKQEAVGWFPPGGRYAFLGRYEMHARNRSCNAATGCTAWVGKQITFPGGIGRIEAVVDDWANIDIELGGSICRQPWAIGSSALNAGPSARNRTLAAATFDTRRTLAT